MHVVLGFLLTHPDQLQQHRGLLLFLYNEKVLGGKETVTTSTRQAYSKLLATVMQDELKATLIPTLMRMVRRSPEQALVNATALLSAVKLDLSG